MTIISRSTVKWIVICPAPPWQIIRVAMPPMLLSEWLELDEIKMRAENTGCLESGAWNAGLKLLWKKVVERVIRYHFLFFFFNTSILKHISYDRIAKRNFARPRLSYRQTEDVLSLFLCVPMLYRQYMYVRT